MSRSCECRRSHAHRRIVLTGGPGAGKTAVLELVRHNFCKHVHVLPEAAGVVFGGGFPRRSDSAASRAAQRAIFFVQRELEAAAEGQNPAIILCDRGTIDGVAYWPGPGTLWEAVGTSPQEQLARYDAVIHLRVPALNEGYNHNNPLRVESAEEAMRVDELLIDAWSRHARRFVIEAHLDFLDKAKHVLDILRSEVPECCQHHEVPDVDRKLERHPA